MEKERFQATLSELCTPLYSNRWKDSRVYLKDISGIELRKVEIPDPFPSYPWQIILRDDILEVHGTKRYAALLASDGLDSLEMRAAVQSSHLWRFLNSKAETRDWAPFYRLGSDNQVVGSHSLSLVPGHHAPERWRNGQFS